MDSEDALETGAEGRHRRPVAVEEEVVVLQPVGQHVVRDDPPPPLPHLGEESATQPSDHIQRVSERQREPVESATFQQFHLTSSLNREDRPTSSSAINNE